VRAWWPIFRRSFWEFLLATVVLFGLGGLVSLVYNAFFFTIVLCWIAPIVLAVLMVYASLVYFGLVAQAYRHGMHPSGLATTDQPQGALPAEGL
jgi:cation transporter-like permease